MRTSIRIALAAPLLVLLAGCSPIVALEPAADATDPACAAVIVRLPDTASDLSRRETNAQGTAAWGNPAYVILRCGVPSPGPTSTIPCVTVDGVDWLRDDRNDPNFVFTSYGRTPAVEVIIDSDGDPNVEGDGASAVSALTDLADAVSALPKTGACISAQDATPQ